MSCKKTSAAKRSQSISPSGLSAADSSRLRITGNATSALKTAATSIE